jgi:hypothetical protein
VLVVQYWDSRCCVFLLVFAQLANNETKAATMMGRIVEFVTGKSELLLLSGLLYMMLRIFMYGVWYRIG